ncbi:hypothetical protein E4U19_007154 [Claviceps sp. Clav32 group G5]|nr:hypothetical protein E4U40_003617 [Claviceps sp. LM458 group G5]KAG6032817.1 hypothetical protein E4U19_007154 [Claviceps sp. Clav32 group G5]
MSIVEWWRLPVAMHIGLSGRIRSVFTKATFIHHNGSLSVTVSGRSGTPEHMKITPDVAVE